MLISIGIGDKVVARPVSKNCIGPCVYVNCGRFIMKTISK